MKDTRVYIFIVYIAGLVICLGAVSFLRLSDKIYPDTMTSLLTQTLKLYSSPLGIILAGFFSKKKDNPIIAGPPFFIALALSAVWNLLFCARLVSSCFAADDSPKLMTDYFEKISLYSSFLMAACLSFYFFSAKKNAK